MKTKEIQQIIGEKNALAIRVMDLELQVKMLVKYTEKNNQTTLMLLDLFYDLQKKTNLILKN